jgi:hypothetical protein
MPHVFEALHQGCFVERARKRVNMSDQVLRVIRTTQQILNLILEVRIGGRIEIIAREYVAQACHVCLSENLLQR